VRGEVVKGLVLLAVVGFFAFTPPGQAMYRGVVDWASDKAGDWASDRAEEVQGRDWERTKELEEDQERQAKMPASSCGSDETFGSQVSEAEAIETAADFWDRKRVPCSGVSTEFFEDRGWWTVEFQARQGCALFATVDATTGKALKGGGTCA
jgi:hypothetical protein